jgi:flavorubredoxin
VSLGLTDEGVRQDEMLSVKDLLTEGDLHMAQITPVAEGIYRISSYAPGPGMSYNQFLIDDEHPTLIHTGTYPLYEDVRQAVSEILDPGRLAYIIVPHFEADECGGMGRFVAAAHQAVLVCSLVGARVNLRGWDYAGPVQGVQDGDVLDLGAHRLRFLETPHVHHWDSLMVLEETTSSLFPSDLFAHPGEQPALVRENLSTQMCQWYRELGIFAAAEPVLRVVSRLEKLNPRLIHPMHGGSLPQEVWPTYVQGLRSEPFAFEGKLFGRRLPT